MSITRHLRWIALVVFAVATLSRLPFTSVYLYHWDSVNMAFGIARFDVLNGAPQFPGYIVYIALAQIVNSLFNDAQTTLVLLSIVGSGAAAVLLLCLGRDMFSLTTGLIAALFLIFSPLVWFYSEIALPHTLDMAWVLAVIWLLYRIMTGDTRWLWLAAALLALLGGFRQQDLPFLLPLTLFALWRTGIWRVIQFGLVGLLFTLLWFVPLIHFSGGLQAYLAGSAAYSGSFFDSTSVLAGAGMAGLRRNLISKLIPYALYGWGAAALPALYWFGVLTRHRDGWLADKRAWFLALWIAPALLFYTFIHMGQQGLVLFFLPALMLISAEALRRLFFHSRAALTTAATAIIVISAAIFLLAPTFPLGPSGPKILTHSTLREHDARLDHQIAAIRAQFAPENTLLLASSWRHVQYYLPEYQLVRFTVGAKWENDEGIVTASDYSGQPLTARAAGLSDKADWFIVVVDQELEPLSTAPLEYAMGEVRLPYLRLRPHQAFINHGTFFGIQTEAAP